MKRLTNQDWMFWMAMARDTLAAADSVLAVALASAGDDRNVLRGILKAPSGMGRLAACGFMFALVSEQGLKALAIRSHGSCLKTHDLQELWDDDLPEDDHNGIIRALEAVSSSIGVPPGASAQEIIHIHRDAFVENRYYLDTKMLVAGTTLSIRDIFLLASAIVSYVQGLAAGESNAGRQGAAP